MAITHPAVASEPSLAAVAEQPSRVGLARHRTPPASSPRWSTWLLSAPFAAVAVLVGRDGAVGWQLVRVAVVTGLAVAAVATAGRLRARGRGWLHVAVGVAALAVGIGFVPYVVKEAASFEAAAAVVAVAGGLGLAATGTMVRTRGRGGVRRAVAGAGTLIGSALVVMTVAPAVVATNVPHPDIGAAPTTVGLAYEEVTITTSDGVRLAGWYVPSSNGAAVVLRHGSGSTRSNVLPEADVLARHGFGVLMVDARGHGGSGGRAMDFGWHGDADIAAATAFLAGRDDVDRNRIAVVGSSMGGEEGIGASASDRLIRAVVAEGAMARTAADKGWLSDEYGVRGWFQEQVEAVQYWLADRLTSASSPVALRSAVAASGTTRYLLITAGAVPDEANAAAYIAGAAPDRVETWNVPDAAHTDGLAVAPEEWERRVTTFLVDALDLRSG